MQHNLSPRLDNLQLTREIEILYNFMQHNLSPRLDNLQLTQEIEI